MICEEMKEDLKRMRILEDGRKDVENSGNVGLGFFDDDDDYGALLVDGGVSYGKGWVIDYGCSFDI